MSIRFVLTLLCFSIVAQYCSQLDPVFQGNLPANISDSSGLECNGNQSCWTHNDEDNGQRLFRINHSGDFQSQIILEGADQIDYEDIARSVDGLFYIGDFGNNDNSRQDLRVYISPDLDELTTGTTAVETIHFSLPDQSSFPPAASNMNFDIEAMVHYEDSLYLFTKNRTQPYTGWIKMYQVPDLPGTYTANLVDSVFINLDPEFSSITAADISPSEGRLALISNRSIVIFTDFNQGLIHSNFHYNSFSINQNFEGLAFINNCEVLLSSEAPDPAVYHFNTCHVVTGLQEQDFNTEIGIEWTENELTLLTTEHIKEVQIVDITGRQVPFNRDGAHLVISDDSSGIILIQVRTERNQFSLKTMLPQR